MLANVLASWL